MRQFESARARFEPSNKAIHSLLLWGCCFFQAVAQESIPRTPEAAPPAAMVVEPFGTRFATASPAPLQQARVFVYRPGPTAKSEPVNIYLNGRYHTSLLRGGYTEFCALPGSVAFHAAHADAQKMHTGRQAPAQSWSFQAGKTLFLKVQEPGRLAEGSTEQDFSSVERIRVVGHSDAIGPTKLNTKLSMERAKVVAQQLQERGLQPVKGFKIEGEGATHLVKLRCGNAPTPENKLCHAPNRRVEIVVTGARR